MIDRIELINLINKRLSDSIFLPLLEQIVNCEIYAKNKIIMRKIKSSGVVPGKGLRQGMPLSPLLSNFFLNSFDQSVIEKNLNTVRYADDIIVFCNSEKECKKQMAFIEKELSKVHLTIPSLAKINSKTKIVNPSESVIFLGLEIYKTNDKGYLIRIPDNSIEEILMEFDQYSNYQYIRKENLNYISLNSKLGKKMGGYKSSYKDASNLNSLLLQIKNKKREIKRKLMREVMGYDFIDSLSEEQKFFLGFPDYLIT